jgi:hypothetical protein
VLVSPAREYHEIFRGETMNEASVALIIVSLLVSAILVDACKVKWTYHECISRCSVSECRDLRPW